MYMYMCMCGCVGLGDGGALPGSQVAHVGAAGVSAASGGSTAAAVAAGQRAHREEVPPQGDGVGAAAAVCVRGGALARAGGAGPCNGSDGHVALALLPRHSAPEGAPARGYRAVAAIGVVQVAVQIVFYVPEIVFFLLARKCGNCELD